MKLRLRFRSRHTGLGLCGLALIILPILTNTLQAQDHTLVFATSDAGVSSAIFNWGLDTTWVSSDNVQRGLIFIGTNLVNLIRVGFLANEPLTNNDISPDQKATLQSMASLAAMAGPGARWDMSSATGAGVNPWYQSGAGQVYPDRWAAAMEACQRYYNKTMWMVEPFNEPDYGWGQGSQQNLYDSIGYLRASPGFTSTFMAGGSTLDCDYATSWYDYISRRVSLGTTHCLGGSVSSYVGFLQHVLATGGTPFHPEVHNVVETIIGANYGLRGAIWWGTAELARGDFVQACQGRRLAYADDWTKWTAAAVYHSPDGAVQAFLGGSERMGAATSYKFFCKDRDVFYNGDGPRRDYTVTILGNSEAVVNITWGMDAQPIVGGRYIIVNRFSGKVIEVPNASTAYGTALDQNVYSGASNQLWDVHPLASNTGGDLSYYTLAAAHSGFTADESNWSYNDGNNIIQWGTGANLVEHWFFEYVGNGYFYIRSRWSGKYLDIAGPSLVNGAGIVQWSAASRLSQQWRLIPAGAAVEFVAPATPTGLSAVASAVSVQLNWNTNTEPDLAGYNVLRAPTSGGPYEIVARGLTNNAFRDKSANQPRTYFYVVQAVDRSLNTSTNSAEVSATPTCGPTLVARYAFNGDFNDTSGNANNASTTGAPTFATGKYGSALNLNGAGQYAMLPANMLASVTNFTVAAWVNWAGGNAWQRIFDFVNDTTHYMFLTPGSGSGTLRFTISTGGAAAEQIVQTSLLAVGQWQHVAVTLDANTARLYTNGVLAASGPVTIAPAAFNPVLNYLGAGQYPADPFFNGRLDEVFIYNYALSSTEIAHLAANQPPPPTVPTTLSILTSSNALRLTWPYAYLGCRLESNAVSLTATGSWFSVSGSSATNQISLPINTSSSNVFYRLAYP